MSSQPHVTQATQIGITNPSGVVPVYANTVGASGTNTDFRLFFNEMGAMPDGLTTKQTQEIRAAVVLPLGILENLIKVLQEIATNTSEALKIAAAKDAPVVKQ
ncbi:MAG: hypothetical protein ABI197_02175 [Granulicella sp.]